MLNPEQDFKEHIWPYESSRRGGGGLAANSISNLISRNSRRPTCFGKPKADLTLGRLGPTSRDCGRGFWAAVATSERGSRCACPGGILSPTRPMVRSRDSLVPRQAHTSPPLLPGVEVLLDPRVLGDALDKLQAALGKLVARGRNITPDCGRCGQLRGWLRKRLDGQPSIVAH